MASSVSLRFNLPYIPEIVGPIAHEREEPLFEDFVAGDGGGIRLDALILDFLLELEAPSRASTLWLEKVPFVSATICNLKRSNFCCMFNFVHTLTHFPPMPKRCCLIQL